MKPRPLSRREALLGAAMCAALLAWRETFDPPSLRPGPGRSGPVPSFGSTPVDGGHGEPRGTPRPLAEQASEADPADAGALRDAPAEPASFTPLLALPPMGAPAPAAARAPAASAARLPAAAGRAPAQGGHVPASRSAPAASAPSSGGRARRALTAPLLSASELARAAARGAAAAAASRRAAADGGSARSLSRAPASRGGGVDLFKPGRAAVERSRRERAAHPPRTRPPSFDRLLGPRALRPPEDAGSPTLAELAPRQPLARPDGRPARWSEAPLSLLESVAPDDAAVDCRRRDGHWHAEPEGPRVYHAGTGRGLAEGDAFIWLSRLERRWWALPDAARAPWLHHRGRWWVKDEGVWFVLHEGEPWAWRHFSQWEADGLIHPASGTIVVYSADYERAAVITPGEGAVLFDARGGQELARWAEHELPPRWRPAPESLTLPRGI